MKQHILPAIRLTLVCMVFFIGIYSFIIWLPAQLAPGKGKGETVLINNKIVGCFYAAAQLASQLTGNKVTTPSKSKVKVKKTRKS